MRFFKLSVIFEIKYYRFNNFASFQVDEFMNYAESSLFDIASNGI